MVRRQNRLRDIGGGQAGALQLPIPGISCFPLLFKDLFHDGPGSPVKLFRFHPFGVPRDPFIHKMRVGIDFLVEVKKGTDTGQNQGRLPVRQYAANVLIDDAKPLPDAVFDLVVDFMAMEYRRPVARP